MEDVIAYSDLIRLLMKRTGLSKYDLDDLYLSNLVSKSFLKHLLTSEKYCRDDDLPEDKQQQFELLCKYFTLEDPFDDSSDTEKSC